MYSEYCWYCGTWLYWDYTLDHQTPVSRGGKHGICVSACGFCNSQKGDKTLEEYRAWLKVKQRLPPDDTLIFWGEAHRAWQHS